MSAIDKLSRREIDGKVDDVFKDLRDARTPEEVVSKLVDLSDFLEKQDLTPEQIEELRGIGCVTMTKHSNMEFLDQFGVLISLATCGLIAGITVSLLSELYSVGGLFSYEGTLLLIPFALTPVLLYIYGKRQRWFSE